MDTLLRKAAPGRSGTITFHYRSSCEECMPLMVDDPLELLGDISQLCLSKAQCEELRAILKQDIARRGSRAVWQERTFRKNLILSQGRIL